jgi:hypothetical protein
VVGGGWCDTRPDYWGCRTSGSVLLLRKVLVSCRAVMLQLHDRDVPNEHKHQHGHGEPVEDVVAVATGMPDEIGTPEEQDCDEQTWHPDPVAYLLNPAAPAELCNGDCYEEYHDG